MGSLTQFASGRSRIISALLGVSLAGSTLIGVAHAQSPTPGNPANPPRPAHQRGNSAEHRADATRGRQAHLPNATIARRLGISESDLREQVRAGRSLAEIAQARGISRQTLIDGLVSDARAHLAEVVRSGRLTQARADQMAQTLPDRIGALVDRHQTAGRSVRPGQPGGNSSRQRGNNQPGQRGNSAGGQNNRSNAR